MREITPEQAASIQTPEARARRHELVAEEGQTTLTREFMGSVEDTGQPLEEVHIDILRKCAKPLSPEWESKPTLWELGDEICSAYGLLTNRRLIRWTIMGAVDEWLVAEITPDGTATLGEVR